MNEIILASASPRRAEILAQMGLAFIQMPQHTDEHFSGLSAPEEAVSIAAEKTEACLREAPENRSRWILGADTFIELGSEFLGKPGSPDEARRMLKRLSGKTHRVITGLALHVPGCGMRTAVSSTEVEFSPMKTSEINWYINTGEWQGAAAAYRIQQKGALFVRGLIGSYSNVMGLPINTFYGMLRAENFNFRT